MPAVAGEETAAHAEALEGGVEVGEGGLGQAGHRVSVHCQQGQRLDPSEGRVGDRAQQVEAQVKNLEQEKGLMICCEVRVQILSFVARLDIFRGGANILDPFFTKFFFKNSISTLFLINITMRFKKYIFFLQIFLN